MICKSPLPPRRARKRAGALLRAIAKAMDPANSWPAITFMLISIG